MDLKSTSTFSDVTAAYENNLDYDLAGSPSKCRAFIQAARFLLRRQPDEQELDGERTRDNPEKIQAELAKAESWLAANAATNYALADFSGIRS